MEYGRPLSASLLESEYCRGYGVSYYYHQQIPLLGTLSSVSDKLCMWLSSCFLPKTRAVAFTD